jgi:hypothetical protein
MRDIRFRVWNGEYMVSEEYDCYISDGGGIFIEAERKHNTPYTEIQSAKTLEIMQYTGLHDRNGTEIYEGDISDGGGIFIEAERKHNTPYTEIQSAKTLEIMQYTGLHDRNGTEIYEGDIVQFDDKEENYVVKWARLSGAWEIRNNENHFLFVMRYIDMCEVIGNIYENPELMKGTNERWCQ